MAEYEVGYDSERFKSEVSEIYNCPICHNVLKDPVMCLQNEHLFCRLCISRFLKESSNCPVCREDLSCDTLTDATRFVKQCLAELQIRCDFFERGCEKYIELGQLEKHIEDCGFSPAICSNDGCCVEVNKRDLANHVSERCELRKAKCDDCSELRLLVEAMILNLAEQNKKLETLEQTSKHNTERLRRALSRILKQLDALQKHTKEVHSTVRNESLEAFLEIKVSLDSLDERMTNISKEQIQKKSSSDDVRSVSVATEPCVTPSRIIVAGGRDSDSSELNSVEMFSLSDNTWCSGGALNRSRVSAASFIFNNNFYIAGGCEHSSMETVSQGSIQYSWCIGSFYGHACVMYNKNLYIIGGYWKRYGKVSDVIHRYLLPSVGKGGIVANMPEPRIYHAALLFGDDIFILGGTTNEIDGTSLNSVVKFSIKNLTVTKCAPLPFAIKQMAAVRWGGENIAIMGGVGEHKFTLDHFLMYNVKTGEHCRLPNMKYRRHGCCAVVAGQRIIVLGGGTLLKYLATVEAFSFKDFSWSELPPMKQQRGRATAGVVRI